ncbi:MAG: BREX-1 system adenine-specific DNA-methyltransferase PglX, partial [Acidobacteria bacterium]|nr:BREX-1 system adenine-specific DNA-methyltransferase PglX [Acidobacteriota bacterium]
MNRNKLEAYAQQARRDFIEAVTGRAAFYGLSAKSTEPIVEQGDVALIGARAFPRNVAVSRKRLEEQIRRDGFERVMETMAYTWFNRFAAIRYMELHGYLDHGYRVLSHPEGHDQPEILEHAADVDLPGLDRENAVELRLDGNKDEELYWLLLKAQCNALHQAMPFLFERIGNETELLLPANLLHTDSVIRQMVERIDESAWEQIEIIGWLYQFYISEKKAQVIGKVVASEDIPAATQLFTPNWIVKYMVQNSLGAQWLGIYPHSSIKEKMDYYIEPAEQPPEVIAQLAAITPGTLNPEALTLIDPASGSGHILVEAYDLFRAIYLERGYRQRDVAQLILENNLFGLDIDGRAAQLTGFALMMKGRADDRRLFGRDVKLNVMALVDSAGFDAEQLAQRVKLADYGLAARDLLELKRLFEHATTFGSLIQVPEGLVAKLPALKRISEATSRDLFVTDALQRLGQLVRQAEFLATQYDV